MLARSWRRDPRRFGRAAVVRTIEAVAEQPSLSFGPDLRLFLMTFLTGFVFVSILLA